MLTRPKAPLPMVFPTMYKLSDEERRLMSSIGCSCASKLRIWATLLHLAAAWAGTAELGVDGCAGFPQTFLLLVEGVVGLHSPEAAGTPTGDFRGSMWLMRCLAVLLRASGATLCTLAKTLPSPADSLKRRSWGGTLRPRPGDSSRPSSEATRQRIRRNSLLPSLFAGAVDDADGAAPPVAVEAVCDVSLERAASSKSKVFSLPRVRLTGLVGDLPLSPDDLFACICRNAGVGEAAGDRFGDAEGSSFGSCVSICKSGCRLPTNAGPAPSAG
mmetsp:Transcript_7451/g.16467  ORF Transcript_7451/g.16467 Transcript_7451/m.16467 type:complete len:272 (+) Transcript_7451:1078-1893(+)